MRSDQIFGLVVVLGALAYIVSAFQIQTSFMADPVGSKTFPILIGAVAIVSGLVMVLRPDPEATWPDGRTWLSLVLAVVVLIAYAYGLKPLGFLLPTAVAAGIISYQIHPRAGHAVATGIGLSIGLFLIFKYALGLGLVPLPPVLAG